MAKKAKTVGPKEAALREMRDGGNATQSLYDDTDFQEKLAALEERQKKERDELAQPLSDGIAAQKEIIAKAQAEISRLETIRERMFGIPQSKAAAVKGDGGRMNREEKKRYAADALAFLQKNPDGVSRSAVAEALKLSPAQTATVLKALRADKAADSKGEKAAAKWFAA